MNSTLAGILAKIDLARSVGFSISPAAVWNYLKFRLYPHCETMSLDSFGPFILNVLITRRCNFNCSFCIANKQLGTNSEGQKRTYGDYEASPERFQAILDHSITRKILALHFIGANRR